MRRFVRAILGPVLAVACLVWVFHDLRLEDLAVGLRGLRWGWVALAIVSDTASYVCQGLRWSLLLAPAGRVSPLYAAEAVYAGLFVNEILPMRLGEGVRAILVARRLRVSPGGIVPSILVERLLDGVWLAWAVAAVAALIPLPKDVLIAGDLLGAFIFGATAVFVFFILRPTREETPRAVETERPGSGVARWRGKIREQIQTLSMGLRGIGRSRSLWGAWGSTASLLFLQGVAYWCMMRACNLDLPLSHALAVFILVHLGTALPNTPGNVGSYQLFTVLGLSMFGVQKSQAAIFSVLAFVLLTLPMLVLGYAALLRSGLDLRKMRNDGATSAISGVP